MILMVQGRRRLGAFSTENNQDLGFKNGIAHL